VFDTPEDRSLARDIAARSIVLLKNDGDMLPMRRDHARVAVIGPSAASWRNLLGDYTYPAIVEFRRVYHGKMDPAALVEETTEWPNTGAEVVTVLDGIRACVSPKTEVVHEKGCSVMGSSREGIPRAVEAARGADAAVLVVGGRSGYIQHCTSGEERDRCRLTLPGAQEELVREVLATGTPAVLVLVGGRTYSIGEFIPGARAALHAWLPGEEGGRAIAEVLFGDRNPGGRLPVSVPREVGQIPVHYAHKPSARRSHLWGGTVEGGAEPLFAFGHGLSYTGFEYAGLLIDPPAVPVDGAVVVRFRLRNVGPRDGDECVQIYTRDLVASVTRPVKELKAFRRVALAAGAETEVVCEIPTDLLAFIDRDGEWVVEPGAFEIYVGASSADLRLRGKFDLVGVRRFIGRDRAYFARIADESGREEGR
jgi:beta-glucosidase